MTHKNAQKKCAAQTTLRGTFFISAAANRPQNVYKAQSSADDIPKIWA